MPMKKPTSVRPEEVSMLPSKEEMAKKMEEINRQKAIYEDPNHTPWNVEPPMPSDDEIVATYDADVVIIGLGHAGSAALRGACEANPNAVVYALEMYTRDTHWSVGHDIASVNAKVVRDAGVPHIDEVEFFNNWMVQAHGKVNANLVMEYVKNSGAAIDWWMDPCSQEIKDAARVMYWPDTGSLGRLNNGLMYYVGCVEWWTHKKAPINNNSGLETKDLVWGNLRYVEKNFPNAHLQYGFHGEHLIKDEKGEIAGLIAVNDEGKYVKYNCKSVILATGGFAANYEMTHELLPNFVRMRAEGDSDLISFILGRDGSGHKMGVWAGGRLEPEISTMNFDSAGGPDNYVGGIWLDENLERFTNETFAGPELEGFMIARTKRGRIVSITDSHTVENARTHFPCHGSYEWQNGVDEARLEWHLYEAYEAGKEGKWGYVAADTLEQLAEYLGYNEEQTKKFIATIDHYNELCEAGRDDDFGRDPRTLFPIKDGPFFAHKGWPRPGGGLCTTGGFITDKNQCVVGMDYKPIPGLYATGNTCGMRFGSAYITPICGVSIGMCVTLGRSCGQHAVEHALG